MNRVKQAKSSKSSKSSKLSRSSNPFGFTSDSSVLCLDAHPSSTIRTCGGAILLAKRLGAKVALCEPCDGGAMVEKESDGPAMAELRRGEIHRQADILGVGQENLYFFGFPDGGLEPIRHDYWRSHGAPYYCPFLKIDRANSPEAVEPGVPFFGQEFHRLLRNLLVKLRPTHIFVHHDRDTHMDHRAINWFVKTVSRELTTDGTLAAYPTIFEWITYYTRMPWPPLAGHGIWPPKSKDVTVADARKLGFPGRIVRYTPPAADQKIKVKAWRESTASHGLDYVNRHTKTAEVFWVQDAD